MTAATGYGVRERAPVLRPGTPEEAGMSAERLRLIETRAQGWVDSGMNPALVLLVARHGIVVLFRALGRMSPDPDAPVTALDAIFPLNSISKTITATAAMCLVEDGLLGLHRPVQEYIPEFAGPGTEAIMVHHLLTHTTGFDESVVDSLMAERRGAGEIPPCPDTQHPAVHEWLSLLYGLSPSHPPGQDMRYWDGGYELLGEIVRRLSGTSLEALARARILGPLGMNDTFYALPEALEERVIRRHPLDPPPFGLDDPAFHREPWPSYGVLSTAMDMAVFLQMFLNGGSYGGRRVLSRASVRAMTRNQLPGIPGYFFNEYFPEAAWSYGWGIKGEKKARGDYGSLVSPAAFGHGGGGGVAIWGDPIHDLSGVYLSISSPRPGTHFPNWAFDLFSNMASGAVIE